MHIRIRKIEERDFPGLISLFREFAIFEKLPNKMINSIEQMKSEKKYINGFVAVSDKNEIFGYVTYFFAYYTWIGKSLYMDDLYVKETSRGVGIGRKLLDKVIDLAKAEHCKKIRWQVSEWNQPAIEFYQSIGATIDGVESNCDLMLND